MKKITFIAAAVLPVLSLISCGEKEAPATTESKPAETAAPAETAKTPVTADDYAIALCEAFEELAGVIEATTPANSAEQAKKISELGTKIQTLLQEAEAKGLTNTEPVAELKARMEAAQEKVVNAIISLIQSPASDQLAPSFKQALEGLGF